jgi:hypothetical protein
MLNLLLALVPLQVQEGFRPLFDGTTLAGWWGLETDASWRALSEAELTERKCASLEDIRAHWRVENGELVNDGEGLYLTTDEQFGDFELLLEYRTVALADSGVYLRGLPQVQIWDATEAGGKWPIGAKAGSGGLWNNSEGAPGKDPLVHADKPFGEWNALRVLMVGERVSVWLNGALVVDHARMENYFDRTAPVPRTGPIQLQTHGGEIRWRHLYVRTIEPEEANEILRASGDRGGFVPVFNGRDLSGWAGPLDGYEVRGATIACKPGSGGTIYTQAEYGDFEVELELQLPPGGNNGLAIRYPGAGDTAYVGMCELQVLDSEHPKYAQLDPRQYHGSAYGQAAAHRGYLHPSGEWNHQRVTVVGSRITVELNGTRILDSDLARITEFLYEPERFAGRLRTRGHFGLAGHDDPVRFRRLRIRSLD